MKSKSFLRSFLLWLPFLVLYLLYKFLPFSVWIGNEYGFLAFKILFFVALDVPLLLYKKKNRALETPEVYESAPYWTLLPLLICCFSNFLTVPILSLPFEKSVNAGILVLDILSDYPVSLFEDVFFLEMGIAIWEMILPHRKGHRMLSGILASLIYMLCDAYSFHGYPWDYQVFQDAMVFLLAGLCAYLALHYESLWLAVSFHFLFNVGNFILFHAFVVEPQISPAYLTFSLVVTALTGCYAILHYRLETRLPRKRTEAEEGRDC